MQVNRRGFDEMVSQELLNDTQVDTFFEHVCGKGMPHGMKRDLRFNLSFSCCIFSNFINYTLGKAFTFI